MKRPSLARHRGTTSATGWQSSMTRPEPSPTTKKKHGRARDQTKETLEILLERKYKEIDGNYKMLKKISNIEDAKKLVEEIWQMKSFANAIEMELTRREYNNGTTS